MLYPILLLFGIFSNSILNTDSLELSKTSELNFGWADTKYLNTFPSLILSSITTDRRLTLLCHVLFLGQTRDIHLTSVYEISTSGCSSPCFMWFLLVISLKCPLSKWKFRWANTVSRLKIESSVLPSWISSKNCPSSTNAYRKRLLKSFIFCINVYINQIIYHPSFIKVAFTFSSV